jgi:hypothetical protein
MSQLPRIRELSSKPIGLEHLRIFRMGRCQIFVGWEPEAGGWHLSISCPDRYPSWDEIKKARYELLPHDVTMAMILPPESEYVNVHQNCFHLHEISGEELPRSIERGVLGGV